MNLYYYTVASLPALKNREKAPLTKEKFLEQVQDFLTPQDFEILASATVAPTAQTHWFLKEWGEWETGLRNQLALLRGVKLARPYEVQEGTPIFGWEELARTALQKESPLEAELFLDDLRWQYLDDRTWNENFTLNWLLAYSLKLQILIRQDLFERELGQTQLNVNYQKITSALAVEKESGE